MILPSALEVRDLDWDAIRRAVDPEPIVARMSETVERMAALLESARSRLFFAADRPTPSTEPSGVGHDDESPLWIRDLHGDLWPGRRCPSFTGVCLAAPAPAISRRLNDDEGLALEVRAVFELIAEAPRASASLRQPDEALTFTKAFCVGVSRRISRIFERTGERIDHRGQAAFADGDVRCAFFRWLPGPHGAFHWRLHAAWWKAQFNATECLSDSLGACTPQGAPELPNRFSRGANSPTKLRRFFVADTH